MITEITKGNVQVNNGGMRELYEFCVEELKKPTGRNSYFSLLVYSNEILLRPYYGELMSKWYDEHADQKFMEYQSNRDAIILKHADRKTDGSIIYEAPNQPQITENRVEFENDLTSLNNEYKETLESYNEKCKANVDLMNEVVSIPIFCLKPELMPDDLPARIVGYFGSNIIKELFND